MNELIKLIPQTLDNEQVNTVNARELHEFLGSRQDFSTWIKARLVKARAKENKDFCTAPQTYGTVNGGHSSRLEYFLSFEIAKHIALMENTDKGFEVRDYFIECEKQLQQTLTSKDSFLLDILHANDDLSRAVAMNKYEVGYVKPLEQFKEQAQPKVTYHDMILQSEDLLTITQIANDYPISNQKLNKILQEEGVQYKDKSGIWIIKAAYNDKGLAQTETFSYETNGKVHAKQHLKWTQKGRLFIYELLKDKGILPVVEQTD